MRRYPLTWVCVLLLVAGGVLFFLRQSHSLRNHAGPGSSSGAVRSSSMVAASAGAAKTAGASASAKTNKLSWRLSNTTNSLERLIHNPHAILLENAFIDTDLKSNLSIPKNLQAQGDPGAYLVQARGPASAQFRRVLAAAGASIVSYIPNNAYLVRALETVANSLAASALVQAVIPYEPYYKVQAPLLPMAEQTLPPDEQLNLGLFADDASATLQQIQKLGGIILSEENSAAGYPIVKVEPPANWTAIAALPGVHLVEPYYHRTLANDLARTTLKVSANSITGSNYMNLYGTNVIIEINDGGIDTNHPDFSNGHTTPSRVIYSAAGMDVDTSGHGTHVAGIIAGDGYESTTVINASGSPVPGSPGQFRGKAPFADMLSMNFLDSDQDLQQAAAETNALISNNSWGNGDESYDLEAANYDAATRDALPFVSGAQPVLFVFAAGDGGGNADTIESPGTAKDVITVGALQEFRYITNQVTNADGTISQPWLSETINSNSVWNASADGNVGIGTEGTYGRFKPDVVAPGTFVVSCRSEQWDTNAYYHPTNNDFHDYPDLIPTNSVTTSPFQFFVPSNTVDVIFYTVTNINSPLGLPPPGLPVMPIYVQTNNPTPGFGNIGTNYVVLAPAPQTLNQDWSVEVSNVTMAPLAYDLIVDVQMTNWMGNYYQVLQGMNDSLGTNGNWYRYETGTSMSAPAVAGFLALIQDYFTNQYSSPFIPSPALLKAMAINGARPTAGYNVQINNSINYEGWGLPNLSNSVPASITNVLGVPCSTFFRDQSVTNALATGDRETFMVTLNTNAFGNFLPLRATLAWTDPPGDPAAALKLVNSLELVVTDMDDQNVVYYGNDIGSSGYNNVENPTNTPFVDAVNNIQKVIIKPFRSTNSLFDSHYSFTVIGNRVNVNAVTEATNDDVQDFALVISSGDNGEISNAIFSVTDNGIVSNPTGDQYITQAHTNTVLLNQTAGANTPLLGTNIAAFTTNTVAYSTNGQFTIGMTNQWHFYIVTNTTIFTNAAFITFGASTLSIPRMGVFANSDANSTTPGADLDLLVTRSSTDPNAASLLNLDPKEVYNCVNGVNGDGASLVSGGTDFVAYTNVPPNEVYYIGVKSENHMGAEYDFIPIFTDVPFGSLDQNGNEYLNAINVPSVIPDGTPSHPGLSFVFLLALYPIEIQNVIVTNVIMHQNFGDLIGSLSHGGKSVVLNNDDFLPNPPGPYTLIYDGYGTNALPGSINPSGPGSLQEFNGTSGQGIWQMTEEGTVIGQTGLVENSSIFLQKYQNPQNGIIVTVLPGQWFYTYLNVPNGYTNMELYGSTTNNIGGQPPMQMYLNTGGDPTFTTYLFETNLVNGPPAPAPFPTFAGQWGLISDGPPLQPDTYYIGLYNPGTVAETVYLQALLNGPGGPPQPQLFTATNVVPIINDAVTSSTNTTMFIANTNTISSVNVGFVVQYPRISDLAFTLISPEGQRILLMENRGGPGATNAGGVFYITNSIGTTTANGSSAPETNSYDLHNNSGSISFFFNAYTIPDQLTVYYGNDPTTFNTNAGNANLLFNSQMMSGTTNVTVTFGPGASTYVTFIVNQFGNTNGGSDAWTYTINGTFPSFNYLTFTDNTNLTVTPIKFAIPPFDLRDLGTNYTFGNLDFASNGDYFGLTNIYDPYGGWTVPTNLVTQVTNSVVFTNNYNEVSVISDPGIAYQSNTNSSNFLALGYGIIVRTNLLQPNHLVTVSYQYRGPGIAGWWRGEGDGRDSSDAEQHGQNGSLIGRFSFPAGEVGQAFSMENNGQEYDFAGTNSYVQIRQQPFLVQVVTNSGTNIESSPPTTIQSSYLDVGTGSGLTVEGWINPTNVSCQQPLVEWLARVPTNGSDTNLTIRAGPFLDRATDHYYYLLGPTNWTTSETWAEELGGHLVTLDSADEQNWVFDTFAGYTGRNRNLWIGLTNSLQGFTWSSGLTNISNTNWLFMQPTNCGDTTRNYTFMFGITNQYAGLWALADNNGVMCGPATNIMYGVVEVTNLQTNGVQFWISVTNVPGTTNLIMTNTGCLFANLVDVTNGSHWIYSGPNLIQSNVFQHVALTYDTNSGTAMLFYNGTNVATTNWGVNFVPKTTGDVLLGKDMSLETNNYFGGLMDEVSIYNRALSDAEIAAIYSVSAYTTNRLIGKFDPSITPPLSLAEAQVVFGNMTNTILGENNIWQAGSFTFVPQTNEFPMQVKGIEPGMLFDSFGVSEAPLGNLYYLPEQALDELNGQAANGNWTLEIWDTRNNVLATNANLLSWQLQFILQSNNVPPVSIGSQEPTYVTIPPGQIVTLAVPVPTWALTANNILDSSTGPLNVFYNQTIPPTGSTPPDSLLFSGTTGSDLLTTNNPPPNIIPGQTYYIGLQNTGTHAASAVFEVDFNITPLTNDVPFNDTLATNGSIRYFSFNVTSTNAFEATFQLLHMDGNADLVVSKGAPLPTLTSSDYGSFNGGHANENIYVLTNSMPVPLSAGIWYLGVFNRDSHAVNYTVLAQELDMGSAMSTSNSVTLIQLTNGVPFNFTAGPGAALTNFFYFDVTNPVTINTNGVAVTNDIGSIHFELYNLTGNGDLTVQTNVPPFAPPFFQSSDEPGTVPEFIQIRTNSALTNLAATWYLGVPNQTTNTISFTIIAVIDTNNVFPAFPGAEGAGAGAFGASWRNGYTNNTVYHVVNLYDSGLGSLRDAVSSTNRTVIFDVSGVIYLESPLVITNSYLTIAGQTAPDGGITIAGATTIISTNVHDVVIRYVRFRPDYTAPQPDLFFGNYYSGNIIDLTTNGPKTVATGLNYPTGLAFDRAGNLFEGDQFSGNIYEFPAGGGARITVASGLNQPGVIAINAAGDLFVNIGGTSIYKFAPGPGGAFTQSTFVSGLNGAGGVVFDKEGDLFVGVSNGGGATSGDIIKITPNGVETIYASGLNQPTGGLACDRSDNLFVTHSGGNSITEITRDKVASTFIQGLNLPCAMTFNNADDLFSADQGPNPADGDIAEIAPTGIEISDNTAPYVDHPVSITFPQGPATTIIQGGFGGDTLQFNAVSNVIADHISALWSYNDGLSVLDSSNVTVQWSIISDSLLATNIPPPNGALVRYGGGTVSLHHNLFADNYTGSPRLGDNVSLDFVNNVIYDWVTNAGYSSASDIFTELSGFTNNLNYICNYLIAGPSTITTNIAFWGGTTNTWLFQTNNFMDSDQDGVLNGADGEWNMFTNWNGSTNLYTATNQFRLPPVCVDEAYLAYEKVLDFAGVSMFRREPAETNIVENVRTQTGGIISVPGLLPTISTNLIFQYNAQDGIPDFWKITYGQIITNQYNNKLLDASGYSELEEFDNWLAGPHALTMTNTPVGVDLQKLFGKTGNLSFWLTNAVHGTVYLTNVLDSYTNQGVFSNSIAIFTPTNGAPGGTNYSGLASFDVCVTNNDTVGYFGPVTVSVFVSAVPPMYSEQAGYLTQNVPVTNSIGAYTTIWYLISVPTNAVQATNTLLSAGAPVNLLYSSDSPPTTAYPIPTDFELLGASTNGSAVINSSGAPLPPILVAGGIYYLGVQNTNNFATNYAVQVDFQTVTLPPGVIVINPGQPVTNIMPPSATSPGGAGSGGGFVVTNNPVAYGPIFVPPNAVSATNTILFATGGPVSMYFNSNTVPNLGSGPGDVTLVSSYEGNTPTNSVLILSGSNGNPQLIPGETYYIELYNSSPNTITNAFELNFGLYYTPPVLPPVTNITIVAGNTLNVNDQATDTNAGTLFYYLSTDPDITNATISDTGQITWAVPTNFPSENVLFTTIVSNSYTLVTATNEFTVTVIPLVSPTQPPQTNSVTTNTVSWLAVSVPVDAEWATNILLYATNLPVNVLFTTNFPPTTNGAYTLMFDETNGVSILGTATVPTNIVPGSTYYLGVQDTNNVPVNYAIQVDFGYYSPPVLPSISNQVITAGTTLTVTNTATDTNGVGQLFYTLTTVPTVNATISSGGIITWPTATNQTPGNYVFTTIVTNSVTTLSDTNTFTVTVISPVVGQQPQTNTVAANSVAWMQVDVPTNAEWATNILLFARNLPVNLLYTTNSSPAADNASVLLLNERSGSSVLFTNMATAPTNLVPGSVYYLGVQNTNNTAVTYALQVIFGYPPLPMTVSVSIVYTNMSGTNGFLLTWFAPTNDYFQVQETLQVSSPVWNTFTNIIGYTGPVTTTNGMFTFFDNGAEYPFGPTRFYRLLLLEPNGLFLPNQSNYVLSVSQPLTVTNTAVDSGTNVTLTYHLTDFPTPATNALISTNGIITWTPGPADAGNAFTFTTIVTDNGLPPASATNAFTVFVLPAPVITSATATANSVTLQWSASSNDLFQVEFTTNLVSGNWTMLPQAVSSSTGSFTFTDNNPPVAMKFYRLVWLPPP
jgi:subtilisin-like proprotein convertase family protein